MSKRKRRVVPGGDTNADRVRLNEAGAEVLDDTPVTLPVRYLRGENITERVQRMVEETLSRRAEMSGLETVDEANDFYVEGDDYFPQSEHEVDDNAEAEFLERRANQGLLETAKRFIGNGDKKDKGETKPPPEPPKKPAEGDGGT